MKWDSYKNLKLVSGLGFALGLSCVVSAEPLNTTNPEANELAQHYKDHRIKSHALFYSSPTFHLIPQRNMVTLTTAANTVDYKVEPLSGSQAILPGEEEPERYISKSGWDVSPLVGFSAKRFGVGFAAELGHYDQEYYYEYDAAGTNLIGHSSAVDFSGVGLYLYYIAETNWLPKYVQTTMILGYRKINVAHSHTGVVYDDSEVESVKYRYTVRKIEYGFNIGILLAKRFTVLPWFNYENRIIGEPEISDLNSLQGSGSQTEIRTSQSMVWDDTPRHQWGIDFAIQISRFNINLGGLLGLIANLQEGSDQITDEGQSVSVTYSFKGR